MMRFIPLLKLQESSQRSSDVFELLEIKLKLYDGATLRRRHYANYSRAV